MTSEEFIREHGCELCGHLREWTGPYGMVSVPACDHPAKKRMQLIPNEMDGCPKDSKKWRQ